MLVDGTSQEIIDEFARISPIAWSHIAFTGKYNFRKSNGDIDVDAMANELEELFKTALLESDLAQNEHFWGFFHWPPLRLSSVLGRSAESWLKMQDNFHLWEAKQNFKSEKFKLLNFA